MEQKRSRLMVLSPVVVLVLFTGLLIFSTGTSSAGPLKNENAQDTVHFTGCAFNTGNNEAVLVPHDVIINGNLNLAAGDEVAIFTRNGALCVGAGVWVGGSTNIALTAWGDNTLTPAIDGLQAREIMQFRIWDQSENLEYVAVAATYREGDEHYDPTSFIVLDSINVANDVIYLSTDVGGVIGNIQVADEDIYAYDPWVGEWFYIFDGSDVDLGPYDIKAFHLLDDGDILLSFNIATNPLPGVGVVDDSDIIRFTPNPSSSGVKTSGTFTMFFDGSDHNMIEDQDDIDAIGFAPDGRLLISPTGDLDLAGLSYIVRDEDLVAFTPDVPGDYSAGTWENYFDGSAVGLTDATVEDIGAAWVDSITGDIYLAAYGPFSVTGASGDGADIFRCVPGSLGQLTTTCTFNNYIDGQTFGIGNNIIDGLSLKIAPTATDVVYATTDLWLEAGNINIGDEDIFAYSSGSDEWFYILDGSDIGLQIYDLKGFHIMDNGDFLLTLNEATVSLPGVGVVDDSDIIRFTPDPSSSGRNTSGTLTMFFDGSVHDMIEDQDDIDAIGFTPDGRLLISPTGDLDLAGLSYRVRDEDLVAFMPDVPGDYSAGTWENYFDGSAVGLTDATVEDIGAAWVDSITGDIYLAAYGAFSVTGVSGDGSDIFRCVPGSLGQSTTTCTFNSYLDGSTSGFGNRVIDGIFLDFFTNSTGLPLVINTDSGLQTIRQPKD